jgi:hypothetical protein
MRKSKTPPDTLRRNALPGNANVTIEGLMSRLEIEPLGQRVDGGNTSSRNNNVEFHGYILDIHSLCLHSNQIVINCTEWIFSELQKIS